MLGLDEDDENALLQFTGTMIRNLAGVIPLGDWPGNALAGAIGASSFEPQSAVADSVATVYRGFLRTGAGLREGEMERVARGLLDITTGILVPVGVPARNLVRLYDQLTEDEKQRRRTGAAI